MKELGGCMPRPDPSPSPDETPDPEPGGTGLKPFTDPDPEDCPEGFIPVPGSITYGQPAFCVMKYEAQNNGSNKAVSEPYAQSWTNISKNEATEYASEACDGCHLITESEWLTIAQNVMGVADNWSSNKVASGTLYSGAANLLSLDLLPGKDSDGGYYGLGDSPNIAERRTYRLSNGGIIWDFSGKKAEYVDGRIKQGTFVVNDEALKYYSDISTESDKIIISPQMAAVKGINNQEAHAFGLGRVIYPNNSNKPVSIGNNIILRGSSLINPNFKGVYQFEVFCKDADSVTCDSMNSDMSGFRVAK